MIKRFLKWWNTSYNIRFESQIEHEQRMGGLIGVWNEEQK